jgi:AcrR family transcriptional regulator
VKRGKHAPRDLTAERIRDVALSLIDRGGLDEFSTRKLGEALGCEAMAIYYYYPSKEALLDAVVDQMMAGVAAEAVTDEESTDWVAAMRRVAHAYRNVARVHPKAFPLLATRRFASESTYAFLEELFALAKRQRISDRTVARFYRVVSSYCSGFALNELAQRREPATTGQRARFARIAAVSAYLEPEHADDTFSFGLEILLDSLAATAKRKAA